MNSNRIQNLMFPEWENFDKRSMERMMLLFVDAHMTHVTRSSPEMLPAYFEYADSIDAGFDSVQLHGGRFFNHAVPDKYVDCGIEIDEETNAFLDKAIEICKANNKKVCYMMGEFTPIEPILKKHPEIRNLNTGLFFELMYETCCAIIERFPQLDEIGMWLFESKNILHYNNFFSGMNYGLDFTEDVMFNHQERILEQEGRSYPYLTFADHLRLMVEACARACRDKGKRLTLLTHIWFPYQEELLYEALKDLPTDLPVLLEHNYTTGDFNPWYPAPKLAGRLPHLKHGIVFCCGMEYHGLSLVPCCFPESESAILHEVMAATPNLERITVRPIWDGQSLLGSPNEVNLYYILKATKDPMLDTETAWADWIRLRYGIEGNDADTLADALRRSYQVVKQTFFEFGIRTNDHSHIPAFGHLESRLHNYGKAQLKWIPTYDDKQNVYDLLISPGRKILRLHREKHEEALASIEYSLAKIGTLKDVLKAADLEDITTRFTDLRTWVTIHQYQYDAYIRILAIRKDGKSEEQVSLINNDLQYLGEVLKDIEDGTIHNSYLFSPDHIRTFIKDVQIRLEKGEPDPAWYMN